MSKTKARAPFIEGYYSAHESRFESNPTSGFCGGEIQPYTPARSHMKPFAPNTTDGGASTPSQYARRGAWVETRNSSADAGSRVRRPLVAHQANTPSIRLGEYARRTPKGYFYLQGKAPLATETSGHGGLFYDC